MCAYPVSKKESYKRGRESLSEWCTHYLWYLFNTIFMIFVWFCEKKKKKERKGKKLTVHDKEKNETPLMDFKCTFYVVFHSPPRVVEKKWSEGKKCEISFYRTKIKKHIVCMQKKSRKLKKNTWYTTYN